MKEVEKWYRLRICIYIDGIVKRHEGFIYQVQKCLNMLTLWKFQNGNESMWILLIGLWVCDVYDYDVHVVRSQIKDVILTFKVRTIYNNLNKLFMTVKLFLFF